MPWKFQDLGLQTEILAKAITQVIRFSTSAFALFPLIVDPKVVVVTETINSKAKIKLRWSMFNLENNNKNTEQSLPMTRSSTDVPKVASATIPGNVGNKLMIIKETV